MTVTPPLSFEQKLRNYAELTVQVGAGVQPGQRVLIESPVETAPLARLLVDAAYRAGASFADVRWDDDAVVLSRFRHAPDGSFETVSRWRVDAETEVAEAGGSVIAIRATHPNLLGAVDPARVTAHQRALATYRRPYSQRVMTNRLNWNLISAPIPEWAALMFPGLSPEAAVQAQWDAIFAATRADQQDPIAAWKTHLETLKQRRERLTERQYHALHFLGGSTDLTVGLADGHVWGGGSAATAPAQGLAGGIEFTANIPTEEVWTAPHRARVDGVVVSTKPLSYNGTMIQGIRIRFEGGRIVEAGADSGQDTLRQMIETDEGSHRLGEVALVPHSSPISRSGLFFYNTLYDENAASHIAIGAAYRYNLRGGVELDAAAFEARGGNDSLTHVDWMIGSEQIDVDGLNADGSREAVMRAGEFVS
ncbi:aminopeptidase [Deinococcus sp.]|uniref:aminopeptidase n=1 Tax=Deinococcus sp. TaxID=47478 RepID=UPI003CC5F3BE